MTTAVSQSLSTLLHRSTLDDHEEVLKACNATLKKNKTDVGTQHIKAVALLKLDRYDDAARFFEEAGDGLKGKAKLEYAYTLYKVGKLQEAAELASQIGGQRAARHVEAQSSYRAENFSHAVRLYESLKSDGVPAEAHDLRINRGAVDAQLQWTGNHDEVHNKRHGREDLEAFETTYNAACGSIARGELGQAEVLLKRAKELCKYSEDLSAEEKSAELLPINVQQLYVLERLGKADDAERISSEITVDNIPDLSTRKIAQNNLLVASSKPPNHFLTHKLFNSTLVVPESDRLFSFQLRGYASNAKTVDLQAFKFDGVAESTSKAISSKHAPTTAADVTTLAVLNAAAHGRNQTGSAALKHILPELEKRPNDVGLIITVVQMYMLTGNVTSATILLESFLKRLDDAISERDQDVRFSPGLVAILISLYKVQGRRAHIKQELAKAAVYWRRKSKAPQSLLQAAGAALLGNPSSKADVLTASEIFAKLHEQNTNDKAVLAGLVASKAMQEHHEISSELNKLTPVSDLIKGVDVAALEKAGIPQSSNALAIAQQISSRKRPADGAQSKPKRLRKSRLPKDYEPGKTPDPERWLPLRDRSNYRPKGKKKGKKDGGDRTQGGLVADDVGAKDTAAKTPTAVIGGGNANKKKKGKGKK